jgi:hypothetical protein
VTHIGFNPLFGSGGPIPLIPFPSGEGDDMVRGTAPLFNSPLDRI